MTDSNLCNVLLLLCILLGIIASIGGIIYLSVVEYNRIIKFKKNEEKKKSILDRTKILLEEDIIDKINTVLDTHISNAGNNYIILTTEFISEDSYINTEQQKEMADYIFQSVKQNLSPEMIDLLSLIYNIKDNKDLYKIVEFRIKLYLISKVIEINKEVL